MARSKTRSSRKTWKPRRISFPRFSTPSFPFCTIPKTENSEMKTSECCSSLFTKLRVFPTPSFPFCTIPKTENLKLETSEFSLRFTRTAIFLNYLIKLRGLPTPRSSNSEFSILHHTQNGKPRSLIRRRWRKLRGFHLRVFRFECSAKWKSWSWKTSEFEQSTSRV